MLGLFHNWDFGLRNARICSAYLRLIYEHTLYYLVTVIPLVMSTREHLGVSEDDHCDVTDPVDVNFYKNVWLKQASINTTVFDKVHLSVVRSLFHT